jgi:hypothetical protein
MSTYNATTKRTLVQAGKKWTVRYTITLNGVAVNVSTWTFRYTVKKSIDDAIGDAKFQKTNGTGIVMTQAASGIVDVVGAAVDTAALTGPHRFDFEGQAPGSDAETLDGPAEFFVEKPVTTPGVAGSPTQGPISFPAGLYIDGFFYMQDDADNFWTKWRIFNRNWELVAASLSTPPF